MRLKNGSELIIREARKEDAAALISYVNTVAGESDNLTFGVGEFNKTVGQEEAYIESLAGNPSATMLVGTVDDRIICCGNIFTPHRARFAHNCEIAMSVLKEFWGLGAGTHLIEALIAFAKSTGTIEIIHLRVRSGNARAIALYKKMGFQQIGLYPKDAKINGKYHDTILMNLYL